MNKFELKEGRIIVDGHDLSNVTKGFVVQSKASNRAGRTLFCEVELDCICEVEIEAEAIVYLRMPNGDKYRLSEGRD